MKSSRIRLVVLLGLLAIAGIVGIQLYWLKEAFDYEEQKFSQQVHVALLEVVLKLYSDSQQVLPETNPVKQVSKDYYIVNINNDFEAEQLDFYLRKALEKAYINMYLEYSIYDCETDKMVYGGNISYQDKAPTNRSEFFPKDENLVYYFAVRFPGRNTYFFGSQKLWIILTAILLLVLAIYVYSIFIILQQKRYAELQKDFINNMTHEFKTPLSSILIASDYLTQQQTIASDQKLNKYAETIRNQGKRLNTHVEKILQLAKSENHPLQLEKAELDVLELVESVRDNILLKYPETEIEIIHNGISRQVKADEVHFSNLIFNLLENSVKYCDTQARINIELVEESEGLTLSVEDNGRGIPLKHQKQIFKQFYRVPHLDKDHVNGFGLGLYYVKKICNLHGWQINLFSQVGKGCRFEIILPRHTTI